MRMWCNSCVACCGRKTPSPKPFAALQPISVKFPMQMIAVDFLGPLPVTSSGNRYILVAGDYFTKWIEVYSVPNQESITVADKLVNEMFCRFGPPVSLHSGQGRQFEAELIAHICRLLHIRTTRTSSYHPQSDGFIERFNRTILSMLASWLEQNLNDWDVDLKALCQAYNTSVQDTTGYIPFFLMFGREIRMPVDLMHGLSPGTVSDVTSLSTYVQQLQSKLTAAYTFVHQNVSVQQRRQKENYDQKIHGKPHQISELVWLHTPVVKKGQARKFHQPWTGPYKVRKKLSDVNYL